MCRYIFINIYLFFFYLFKRNSTQIMITRYVELTANYYLTVGTNTAETSHRNIHSMSSIAEHTCQDDPIVC